MQRERRFLVPDEGGLLAGAMDRVVLALRDGLPRAAEIVDFKTDRLAGGPDAALAASVEHYRPQMQAYRRALCALTGLAPEAVACRLLFLEADAVKEV
ncbi:MAG TPA: PD-(D/E)XK nuclease family protein [Planctomycetota bacterium]|nr:PD-(D/E)XK nuclease family protein [Planctomycetota bacterium]